MGQQKTRWCPRCGSQEVVEVACSYNGWPYWYYKCYRELCRFTWNYGTYNGKEPGDA